MSSSPLKDPAYVTNRTDPMSVARHVLSIIQGPEGEPSLITMGGAVLHWHGEKWNLMDILWLRRNLWKILDQIQVLSTNGGTKSYGPTRQKVDDIVEAIMVLTHREEIPFPFSLSGSSEDVEAEWCLTLDDGIVFFREDGDIEIVERTPEWVDPFVIPLSVERVQRHFESKTEDELNDWTPPCWRKCLSDWSGNCPIWMETIRRMFAYTMIPYRLFDKLFLLYGKVRGGKGVICRRLCSILQDSVHSVSLDDISDRFRMWGVTGKRMLYVPEAGQMPNREAEMAQRMLKNIVGRDRITIERKYGDPLSIRPRCVPIISSNEVLPITDTSRGLSSKMVVIPFKKSFLGVEDLNLENKLAMEEKDIILWAMQGIRSLRMSANTKEAWPQIPGSRSEMEAMEREWRPFDSFLEDEFAKNEGGFTSSGEVWERWQRWSRKQGKMGIIVNRGNLSRYLRERSSWDLRPTRLGKDGVRGFMGLTGKEH